MKEKRHLGLIITIIVLAVTVLALGLTLVSMINPLDSITKRYQRNYLDSVLSIQMISNDAAESLTPQIKAYCPEFGLDKYYLAQIDNLEKQKSILFIINPATGKTECLIDRSTDINTSKAALTQNLLATINEEPVYLQEVIAVYNNIPTDMRTNTSLQESLDQVINNKLLLQHAFSKGLTISEQEVDNAINAFLANNGLTLEQLQQNLAKGGSSIEVFRDNIRKSLLLQLAISEITKEVQSPPESLIRQYYDENKESFITIPSAVTRQILIYANESNQAAKLEMIRAIASMFNGTNFCELVGEYSEDLPSVPRCGLYSFQQGQLLPEYEEVVFNSEPGSVKIIRTRLGYHIVQVVNATLPAQLSYEEVKDSISNYLVLINKQAVLNQYIQNLRQEADIVSYID